MKIKTAGCAQRVCGARLLRKVGRRGAGSPSPILPLPSLCSVLAPPSPPPHSQQSGHSMCCLSNQHLSYLSLSSLEPHRFHSPLWVSKCPSWVSPQSGTWWTEPPPPRMSHVARSKMTFIPSTDVSWPWQVTEPQLMSKEVQSYHMT